MQKTVFLSWWLNLKFCLLACKVMGFIMAFTYIYVIILCFYLPPHWWWPWPHSSRITFSFPPLSSLLFCVHVTCFITLCSHQNFLHRISLPWSVVSVSHAQNTFALKFCQGEKRNSFLFWVWPSSLNTVKSSSIFVYMSWFFYTLWLKRFLSVNAPHFLYSSVCWISSWFCFLTVFF